MRRHRPQPVPGGRESGGRAISDIIAPAAMNDLPYTPPPSARKRTARARRAGRSPARTARSRCPASRRRSRCSTRPSAQPARAPVLGDPEGGAIASGNASAMPIAVSSAVPRSGSRSRPSALARCRPRGVLNEQARAQVLDPAIAHVEHDRGGDQAQPDARRSTRRRAPAGRPSATSAARSAGRAWSRLAVGLGARSRVNTLIRAPGTCAAGSLIR